MRVLAISVYKQDTWDLFASQKWFFDHTTENYRLVIVSAQKPPFPWDYVPCQQTTMGGARRGESAHILGLTETIKRFRREQDKYDLGVICDSDAFPVRAGWADDLVRNMRLHERRFAAIVRTENLDVFPHISFVAFFPGYAEAIFRHLCMSRGPGIMRRQLHDVACGLPLYDCFPLLKSNVWSPSPVKHTIYGDVVYHRGASSWDKTSGARCRGWSHYWRHLAPKLHKKNCLSVPATPAWINRLLGEQRFEEEP